MTTTQTAKTSVASTGLYAEHYRKLHGIAERLRNGGPDDVDSLVEDFRQGMASYRICQERLDAIRAEIDAETDRFKPEAA